LQAEILVLRHQLNILRRRSPKRVALGKTDRLVFCGLYRLSPTVLDALKILQPETIVRWHRAGQTGGGVEDKGPGMSSDGTQLTDWSVWHRSIFSGSFEPLMTRGSHSGQAA
jgi:hypothetical protein